MRFLAVGGRFLIVILSYLHELLRGSAAVSHFADTMVAGFAAKGLMLLGLLSGFTAGHNAPRPLYKDPNAPIEDRVSDLLGRMTIEDKMAQLMQGWFFPMAVLLNRIAEHEYR